MNQKLELTMQALEAAKSLIRAQDTFHNDMSKVTHHREKYIKALYALRDYQADPPAPAFTWIAVKDQQPDHSEPVVYTLPNRHGGWSVGIAYWTKSKTWNPEMNSEFSPHGCTHWMSLPPPPC